MPEQQEITVRIAGKKTCLKAVRDAGILVEREVESKG
jgi:hypothetical protein